MYHKPQTVIIHIKYKKTLFFLVVTYEKIPGGSLR